jgi:hypothetical protein
MASYSIQATSVSQQTPVLRKGPISIYASVAAYFVVGENPTVTPGKCALIPAGETRELNLPVKCSKIAILAVNEQGTVSIVERSAGVKASCAQ